MHDQQDRPFGNPVFTSRGTTIFTVMSALAVEHDAINLGQGFPDEDGPEIIRAAAAKAIMEGPNQYPPMMGLPVLRQAVADANKRFYDLDIDWQTEVLVTSGATEALADALLGLLESGDEVVLIEPLYDSYLPIIEQAGAVPRLVRMEPPHWNLPKDDLAAAFNDKTKALVINSPHNPGAKVFSDDDLAFLAELCVKHDVVAICDEVYEHLVFEGYQHRPLMTYPGMRERAVRIGSAGKTFSLTGWKVGYITAAPKLMNAIAKAHQFVTFTTPPALQIAVAEGLRQDDSYFAAFAKDLQDKRDILANGLKDVGFEVMETPGTYFITVDFSSKFDGDDIAFCRMITEQAKVAAVPVSAFYSENGPTRFARFCFCKQPEILEEAVARLKAFFAG